MLPCRRIVPTIGAGFLLSLMLVLCCSKHEPRSPLATPTPSPTTTPISVIPRKPYETAKLFNGITLQSCVEAHPSQSTALQLEPDAVSYTLKLELHLQIPKPASSISDLLAATPELGFLLPSFDQLVTNAVVSPDFTTLFVYKEKCLRASLGELQRLLPLDTLYDCQTILKLQNPVSRHRVLLIQALMNVNADGSDGDRNLPVENHSAFYQPQTNYRWPKATTHPNPCLQQTEDQLATLQKKLDSLPQNAPERSRLVAAATNEQATLGELKRWSFLVGTADPFIVLPSFMFSNAEDHPEIGDYAVVIAKNTLYPAIVGDKGPNYKMGEASLRICQEIDEASTADIRPIDHPTISYLIFTGTAEKPFSSPNYAHWSDRCHALWKEFGGSETATWHEWASIEKPWPTPAPLPTPSPTPAISSDITATINLVSLAFGTNPAAFPSPSLAPLSPPPTQQ